MQIDLTRDQILELTKEYGKRNRSDEDDVVGARMQTARGRGYMIRDDLIEVAEWKWRGGAVRKLCRENTEAEVKGISAASFSAGSERLRIGALLALQGVSCPMASVILHFAFPDRYPILDVRAMKTVGGSQHYTFARWLEYVDLCRKTASRHGITIRELDKALWMSDLARQGG